VRRSTRRLAALETRLAALQPPKDLVTLAEWLQWNETGVQPARWRKSAAIAAHVTAMHERQAQADAALALVEETE